MANDSSTTAREFAFGSDTQSRPSLMDWLVRDLRTASSTDRPAPPTTSHEGDAQASVAPPPAAHAEAVEQALDGDDPGKSPEGEFERYEPIQVEAIDGEVDFPVAASAVLPAATGAAVASFAHDVLLPPPDEPPAASIEAAAPAASAETANVASDVAMSPPEDWLEEDEMGTAGAFFSSNADFDESDESAPLTDESIGSSLSPHVFSAEDEEEDDDPAAPLLVAGVGGGSSRWKTIAAVAAAVLLVALFGQRLARRHAQAAASPPLTVATVPPKAPAVDAPRESPADIEDALATDEAKDGKSASALGGGRGHAGPGSPPSDPAMPGGPSVARFPDLPREILNQLEQVFEAGSGQRNKSATDSIERYSH
jgi:hypothetical protein